MESVKQVEAERETCAVWSFSTKWGI